MELNGTVHGAQRVNDFIEAYDFEVYDIAKTTNILKSYRAGLFATIAVYLVGIYWGQKFMKGREPFKLRLPLFLWNLGLALFSIFATIRVFPETSYLFSRPDGAYLTLCSRDTHNYATSFWGLLFLLSKFIELGDTAFIVLRKQKLIVLHWFHHVATLILCWYGYEYYEAPARLLFLNTFVHSFMYSYYALKALQVKIPKKIAMALTTIQIIQMALLLTSCAGMAFFMAQGRPCIIHRHMLLWGTPIIGIFAILFVKFFRENYTTKDHQRKKLQ